KLPPDQTDERVQYPCLFRSSLIANVAARAAPGAGRVLSSRRQGVRASLARVALPGSGWVPSHWAISSAAPTSTPLPASGSGSSRSARRRRLRTVLRWGYRARAARAALKCSDVHAQGVAQLAVGVGQLAERSGDELAGALLILDGQRDQLDIGEPGDPQVGPAGHQPLGGDGVEVAAPEAG